MKALLVTGGHLSENVLLDTINSYCPDIIVGADSGLKYLYNASIHPDVIVGDFDSLSSELTEYYLADKDADIVKLVPEKDYTDTHVSLLEAIKRGADEICILGATGTRLDHTLANISLLKMLCDNNIKAKMVDEHNEITVITPKDNNYNIHRESMRGDYISLLPLGDKVTGLTLKGFKYNTDKITLTQGISLGVSNELAADSDFGVISFEEGYLMVMITRD